MNVSSHACCALGCERRVPANHLMCAPHWYAVPRRIQRLVYDHYRVGQGFADASIDWLAAAAAAVEAIALAEGRAHDRNVFRAEFERRASELRGDELEEVRRA